MSAIQDLKDQRDEVIAEIDAEVINKDFQQLKLDRLTAKIVSLRARKQALIQAIRDLTDTWNPAP